MTDPHLSDTPLFDELAVETEVDHAGLLDGLPPAGPIRPHDEPALFEDVALPTLGDGEEADDAR